MAYRRYDPRLINLVGKSNDLSQFLALGIPVSTLRQWQKNGVFEFFTLPQFEINDVQLIQENIKLAAKVDAITAEKTLITKTITIFGFQIQYQRAWHRVVDSTTSRAPLLFKCPCKILQSFK